MGTTKLFLMVLGCALFHISSGLRVPLLVCGDDSQGNTTASVRHSLPAVIPAGTERAAITMPLSKICASPQGQRVEVCDLIDVPIVRIIQDDLAIITRTGGVDTEATITVTYYCNDQPFEVTVTPIRNAKMWV